MNNPSDKKLEKVFREEFENFEPKPSAHVWENIEKGLAKAEKKPFPWMRIAASVIVLFVVGWMGVGILEDPMYNKDVFVKTVDPEPPTKTKTTKPEQGVFKIISSGKANTEKESLEPKKNSKVAAVKSSAKKTSKKSVETSIKPEAKEAVSASKPASTPTKKAVEPKVQPKIEEEAALVNTNAKTSAQAIAKAETLEPKVAQEEMPQEIIEEITPEIVAVAPASNVKEIEVKRALDVAVVAADRINNDKIKFAKTQTEDAQEYSYNINLGFISWSGKKTVSN